MTKGRGEKLQIISFVFFVFGGLFALVGMLPNFWGLLIVGGLCGLAGTVIAFCGNRASDKGYWESIGIIKKHVEAARKRQEPMWTPFEKVEAIAGISPIASFALIQFRLWNEDITIPLMIRTAAYQDGEIMNEVAGPSGVINQMLAEPCTFYVSLSHPTIKYQISISGFKYSN